MLFAQLDAQFGQPLLGRRNSTRCRQSPIEFRGVVALGGHQRLDIVGIGIGRRCLGETGCRGGAGCDGRVAEVGAHRQPEQRTRDLHAIVENQIMRRARQPRLDLSIGQRLHPLGEPAPGEQVGR